MSLLLGVVCTIIGVVWLFIGTRPEPEETSGWILLMILRGFNSWFWLLAIVGFGRKYLHGENRVLAYGNQAAYPFYILHQTVIIMIAYRVVQWHLGIAEKYLIISTASLGTTLVLYDLFVKRTNPTRFLFGMKPKSRDG